MIRRVETGGGGGGGGEEQGGQVGYFILVFGHSCLYLSLFWSKRCVDTKA